MKPVYKSTNFQKRNEMLSSKTLYKTFSKRFGIYHLEKLTKNFEKIATYNYLGTCEIQYEAIKLFMSGNFHKKFQNINKVIFLNFLDKK